MLRISSPLVLTIVATLAGCSSSDGPSAAPVSFRLDTPTPLYSGEPVQLTVIATRTGGATVASVTVTIEPEAGASVTPTTVTTGADGRATFTWTPADRDGSQIITVREGTSSREFLLATVPHFASLTVLPADTTLPDFGAETAHRVAGQTTTGRIVDALDAGIIILADEERDLAGIEVVVRANGRYRANGPGRATLVARHDGITSDPVVVRVPVARPVIAPAASAAPVAPGGTVTVTGLGLDQLPDDAFQLDGSSALPESRTATSVTLRAPPASACIGDGLLDISAAGAWIPSPVRFVLDRPGAVQLAAGDVLELGVAGTSTCLQLAPVANAEYVLVLSDARSVEAARTSADQDLVVRDQQLWLRIADRTNPAPTAAQAAARPGRPEHRATVTPLDVIPAASRVAARADDDVTLRLTPWKANDRFTVQIDGRTLPGTVFKATDRLAFALLDEDQATNVPNRLRRFDEGLATIATFGIPLVQAAFGPEWPATSEGSGQTLLLYRPIEGAAGLTAVFRRQVTSNGLQQGVLILLKIPDQGGDFEFEWKTVVHELAHAGQDRHAMIRCRDAGDCSSDWFSRRWAVEGGAELIAEEAVRIAAGLARDGNLAPEQLERANMFGFRSWWGLAHPHWDWGWGYSSSSFLLRDLLERAVSAGASYEAALGAVSRGSLEGWFGQAPTPPNRLGFQQRLAPWLGADWDPPAAVHRAAATVALDDRVPGAQYQAPLMKGLAGTFREAHRFVSGEGSEMAVTPRGDIFAHYTIADAGKGGSYLIESSVPGLRLSIARVR